VSGQQHAPAALYPWENPGTQSTGGWVGPRTGLDGRKISSPPGFDPGPSCRQSVAIPTELSSPSYVFVVILFYTQEAFLLSTIRNNKFCRGKTTMTPLIGLIPIFKKKPLYCHMVRHPRCVFINYNWINQLSNTTIWWLDLCFSLHRYQLHVSAPMAIFGLTD
jgi:hypothetical protein